MLLFSPSKINTFALKKDNYISISISLPQTPSKRHKDVKKSVMPTKTQSSVSKNIDINNLFSDVWTKKIAEKKVTPKKKNTKRLLEIQKKIKTTEENRVEPLTQKLNNSETAKSNNKSDASSTAEQVNEYLAKIQAIVYSYFHVPPNTQGSSVKSVIELNAFGKMLDFRVLTYSDNAALNAEADKIKERLKSVIFPKNPQNRSSRTVVILISKE